MYIDKSIILKNLCYTELVYDRIRKKLQIQLSKESIEEFIFILINETEQKYFSKIGKNYYILNMEHKIKITVNSSTYRIITVDILTNNP
jgi:predicted nucleic acid-binding protein